MKKKQSWFFGPYPGLVSAIAFLFATFHYFNRGDINGGIIVSIASVLFFINFFRKIQAKN
ncbi:hypothetical protein JW949_00985 [Candidatus Woesearchaeota archaeon]|nr:hypothetical protein [Candidatus Woesearchaeota archaeon]